MTAYEFSCTRNYTRGHDHICVTTEDEGCVEIVRRFGEFLLACEFHPDSIREAFFDWYVKSND